MTTCGGYLVLRDSPTQEHRRLGRCDGISSDSTCVHSRRVAAQASGGAQDGPMQQDKLTQAWASQGALPLDRRSS